MTSVSRGTFPKLDAYVAMLESEALEQNLVSKSTLDDVWTRHIQDSAQLLDLGRKGSWVDIGSGAGLPGVVLAILTQAPVTLIEPRTLRIDFLQRVKEELNLDNLTIVKGKAEGAQGRYDNITARAVANLDKLLGMTRHLSHSGTRWVLPKGENAKVELESAQKSWQGRFDLVSSQTHPGASIVIAEGVRSRGRA